MLVYLYLYNVWTYVSRSGFCSSGTKTWTDSTEVFGHGRGSSWLAEPSDHIVRSNTTIDAVERGSSLGGLSNRGKKFLEELKVGAETDRKIKKKLGK